MKKLLLAGAALAALSAGAQAADLGSPRVPIAAAVIAPAFSWTGFYVGLNAGGIYGSQSTTYSILPAAVGRIAGWGFVGGGHVGFNYQINNFVLGIEADLQGTSYRRDTGGAFGDNNQLSVGLMGSVRARAGIAFDQNLLYATGGVAMGQLRMAVTDPGEEERASRTRVGWTVGAGFERAFSPNWTARVEYRYTDFGNTSFALPVNGYVINSTTRFHTITAGVSYLFSTGPSAVVARY